MKLLIGILLVVCVYLISGSPIPGDSSWDDRPGNYYYWNGPVRICGSSLPTEMALICRGWYNEQTPRSHQIVKRRIVDECCKTTCTRKFLKLNYCGTPPKNNTPKITVTTEPTTTESTTMKPTTMKPTTTKPPTTIKPVDYNMYYYALIGRVLADYPKDYPIH